MFWFLSIRFGPDITILLEPCNFRIRVNKLHLLQSLEEITENIPILAHILILLRSNISGSGWATNFNILFLTFLLKVGNISILDIWSMLNSKINVAKL